MHDLTSSAQPLYYSACLTRQRPVECDQTRVLTSITDQMTGHRMPGAVQSTDIMHALIAVTVSAELRPTLCAHTAAGRQAGGGRGRAREAGTKRSAAKKLNLTLKTWRQRRGLGFGARAREFKTYFRPQVPWGVQVPSSGGTVGTMLGSSGKCCAWATRSVASNPGLFQWTARTERPKPVKGHGNRGRWMRRAQRGVSVERGEMDALRAGEILT
ncbi:uncharacterized protein BXZ73DRAFT_79360 [Epithele typhae]|uniref:uncharacterized protein n=1 Tax=Epithele typhae TaxID=378194 RepID=UPI0020074248|nr:uncharacterized protein BXZ73DRAFT_79360 [Epithele typhae]KAH9923961.1 hypothetical protein BXZ73DRAFT_79360 [Epithele typhae]